MNHVPDPKNITEATTLGELHEQLTLLAVIALRIYPSFEARQAGEEDILEASVHHATGFHVGRGSTQATAIEAALSQLRRALLPAALKQHIDASA